MRLCVLAVAVLMMSTAPSVNSPPTVQAANHSVMTKHPMAVMIPVGRTAPMVSPQQVAMQAYQFVQTIEIMNAVHPVVEGSGAQGLRIAVQFVEGRPYLTLKGDPNHIAIARAALIRHQLIVPPAGGPIRPDEGPVLMRAANGATSDRIPAN